MMVDSLPTIVRNSFPLFFSCKHLFCYMHCLYGLVSRSHVHSKLEWLPSSSYTIWYTLFHSHSRLAWHELFEPVINMCRTGFPLTKHTGELAPFRAYTIFSLLLCVHSQYSAEHKASVWFSIQSLCIRVYNGYCPTTDSLISHCYIPPTGLTCMLYIVYVVKLAGGGINPFVILIWTVNPFVIIVCTHNF